MRKTFITVLIASLVFLLPAALSSCMLLFPPHYDTHTVTIHLASSRARFAGSEEAIPYTHYYEVRVYPYQNGEIMKKPYLTTILPEDDLTFTCDTGYYYLEMDAWAEQTGTVVTGHGSTKNTHSLDDGIKVTPGVFELSYEQRSASVNVEMHAASEEEYPVWNITWELNNGEWKQDYEAEETFDWRRMYPLSSMVPAMKPFPTSSSVTRESDSDAQSYLLIGWYLTPDWTDRPVTEYSQLPLQDVTLYARWASSSGIGADIGNLEPVSFVFSTDSLEGSATKEIRTFKGDEGDQDWTGDETFKWFVDGTLVPDQISSVFTYTFSEPGVYTISCTVTSADGSTGNTSIQVLYTKVE